MTEPLPETLHNEGGRPGQSPLLTELLQDQCRRWRLGERAWVEGYLERQPALLADPDGVLDLIFNEIALREDGGDDPRPEEYLARFPHLAAQLRLHFAVDRAFQPSTPTGSGSHPTTHARGPETPGGAAGAAGPEPPQVIPGYEILGVLGRGGM